ncbi:MAG: AsmA family protein [Hyphomicrobiales bacterium]
MRRILTWTLAIAAGASALAAVAGWLVVPSVVAGRITTAVQNRFNATLAAENGSRLSFEEGPSIELSGVTLVTPGEAGVPLVSAQRVTLPLNWSTVFGGEIERHLVLHDAVFTLRQKASDADAALAAPSGASPKPFHIELDHAAIKATDEARGVTLAASDISGQVTLDEQGALAARLRGLLNGQDTTLEVSIDNATRFRGQGSPADITLSSAGQQVVMTGLFGMGRGFAFDGSMSAEAPDARAFLAWLGLPVAGLATNLDLGLDGGISLSGTSARLTGLAMALGPMRAKGSFSVEGASPRPHLVADLAFEKFVTGVYQPGGQAATAVDLSRVWSDKPLGLSDLKALDADVKLSAAACTCAGIETGPASITAKLVDGALDATLTASPVSGGNTTLALKLASGSSNDLDLALTASGVEASDLLANAFGIRFLSGSTDLTATLKARGSSTAELVSTLEGPVELTLRDGKVNGVDIAGRAGLLAKSDAEGWGGGEASLDASGTASATLADGIARLEAAKLMAGGFALSLEGNVDLLRQAVNLVAKPAGSARGLPVAVSVKGPWATPKMSAKLDSGDLTTDQLLGAAAAIASDPALAKDARKAAKKALKDLLGTP